MNSKKRGLGRGLDSLLDVRQEIEQEQKAGVSALEERGELRRLPLDRIQRGRYQPRQTIDEHKLEELADSIRQQGLMQPIVVREVGEARYEIIAGERRWRACQLAGLDEIPVLVRDVPDDSAIAMALIENIQREDLNPMEEARALLRFKQEFGFTDDDVAKAVGKSRSTVTNFLRLNQLHDDVARQLERGDLEMGHARTLLPLDPLKQQQAAHEVIEKRLSVRQTEALVRALLNPAKAKKKAKPAVDPDVRRLESELSEKLGARTRLQQRGKGRGEIVISYNSLDELDGILGHIRD